MYQNKCYVFYILLLFQSLLESRKRRAPGHVGGSGDCLEDDPSSASVLILDQGLRQGLLGLCRLGEELGVSHPSLVIAVKVSTHSLQGRLRISFQSQNVEKSMKILHYAHLVSIAGCELDVDLLVDQGLGLLLVVLPNAGHLEFCFVC